jgi:lysophospholipase L1-like esterase
MNYNATLEDFCQQDKYKSFLKFVDVAGQFDVENNMPKDKQFAVNNRNTTLEKRDTNGVHPDKAGYYQIADAAYRSILEIFAK